MLDNLVNGRWQPPHSGDYLDLFHNADNRGPSVRVARSDSADVEAALTAAQIALASWHDLEPAERESLIAQIPTLISDHRMDLWLEQCCARINGDKAIANGAVEGFRRDFVAAFDHALTAAQDMAIATKQYDTGPERGQPEIACLVFGAASPPLAGLTQVIRTLIGGSTVVVTTLVSTRKLASALLPTMLCAVAGCLPAGVINILMGLGLEVCAPLTTTQYGPSPRFRMPKTANGSPTMVSA